MLTWSLWHGYEKSELELHSAPLLAVLLVELTEELAYWAPVVLQWVRLPGFVRSWKRKWPGYDEALPFEYCYRTNLAEFFYPVYNVILSWTYRRLNRCSLRLNLSAAQVSQIAQLFPSWVGVEGAPIPQNPSNEAAKETR